MSPKASGRKISNVMLTRKFHFRYMGLWMMVTAALVVSLNIVIYLLLRNHLGGLVGMATTMQQDYVTIHNMFVTALVIECILFAAALVALGMFTAHRVSGPYIALSNAFAAVRDGDQDFRLRFRQSDGLDELSETFNAMMDAIQNGVPGKDTADNR